MSPPGGIAGGNGRDGGDGGGVGGTGGAWRGWRLRASDGDGVPVRKVIVLAMAGRLAVRQLDLSAEKASHRRADGYDDTIARVELRARVHALALG